MYGMPYCCQNHVAFVDDGCQSTELFLELTLYVVSRTIEHLQIGVVV